LTKKTESGEKYIDIIVREFENIGYNIKYKVLYTHKYGIPQRRARLIIIGIRKNLQKEISFPLEETDIKDLRDIVKFNMKGSIKINKEDFDMTTIPQECILTDMDNDDIENNPHPYLKLYAKLKNQAYPKNSEKIYKILLSFSKRNSPIHCEIIDIRQPCKTIICTYNNQPRLFVPLKNKNGYYLRCLLPFLFFKGTNRRG
jgi:DNA (cytosine-5)-methyltransferase 1